MKILTEMATDLLFVAAMLGVGSFLGLVIFCTRYWRDR